MNTRNMLQSCISHINNAKAEIESASRMVHNQTARDELDLAYNSLNDTINHCNSVMKFM